MKILALDLGTHTGVAHNFRGEVVAETRCFATPGEVTLWGKQRLTRRRDPRIVRFAEYLAGLEAPDAVVFEDVQFQSYTLQCQLWASFRTCIWLAFPKKIVECVPVQTLKLFATGHGGASKEQLAAALYREHPECKNKGFGHDAIDAIWLLLWAQKTFARL